MILRRSLVRLRAELEKHSGRARSDLAQRIDTARRRFEKTMAAGTRPDGGVDRRSCAESHNDAREAELEQNRQRAEDERARQAIKAARALAAQR